MSTFHVASAATSDTGSYTVDITNWVDSTTSNAATLTVTTKVVPTVTWATPAAITYGTALSTTQLNATSGGVAGTFAYTPAAGTVLNAGASQTLSATFTPTDTVNYATTTTPQTLTVNQAALSATADDKSKIQGTANPALTISYTGFVNGDTKAAITEPAISTTATTTSVAGTYPITLTGGSAANYALTLTYGTLTVTDKQVPVITWPAPSAITYGMALSANQLNATASVPGSFAYSPAAGAVLSAGNQTLNVMFTPTDAVTYATATATQTLTVNKAALTAKADDKSKVQGTANPTLTITYTGFVNGDTKAAITGPTISTTATATSASGTYPITLTGGSAANYTLTLVSGTLTVTEGSYLANLSVRTAMAVGQTLIVGFVVDGGAKPILVRAAGPVLNKFGLTGVVDPQLTLYNGSGTVVASNDNWDVALAPTFTTLGAFAFDTGSKDAALQQSINGPHTAQAIATGPGAILVEAYDAGPNDGRKLVNLSARFQVGTGDNILIAGFVLSGTGTKQVLIRAVGPTLASFGVPGGLADPQFAIFDGGTSIASNNDWSAALSPTFATLGAFALNAGSKDAAIVVTLQAGKSYTVQVSGVGNTTGEALVEIYLMP